MLDINEIKKFEESAAAIISDEKFLETLRDVCNQAKAAFLYERERQRYRHAKPEITGEYFLAGGYGTRDENFLPQFVEIVPAYGCGWSQVYERIDGRTISLEGS